MRSLVRIDGENDRIFPTLKDGRIYFTTRKKQLKGKGILAALFKEHSGRWIGFRHN